MLQVRITQERIDAAALLDAFASDDDGVGAVVSFTGKARGGAVSALELEHYPGMTERQIEASMDSAARRWPLRAMEVVHRVGLLEPGETIVWVGAASAHRAAAFNACEFVMDFLKIAAPFWKRERDRDGRWQWVEARDADLQRARRWGLGTSADEAATYIVDRDNAS
ncbi:MAG: molybdenum cofactor biosynthesis protein MoaE [Halieaceae bacterium]|nr:molybdenum cofactor biosynthesis protein MoaE [Halieaceae bacterium]